MFSKLFDKPILKTTVKTATVKNKELFIGYFIAGK